MKRALVATIIVLTVLAPAVASAQSNVSTGMVRGRVIDANDTPLAVATVEAYNPDTGFTRRAITGSDGLYAIHLVPPGTIELRAALHGLQTEVKLGIAVTLGSQVGIDFQLKPMVFEGELEVTAISPIVESSSSSVTMSVSKTAIDDLPLNGRDITDLILLTPLAVTARDVNQLTSEVRGNQGGTNIGARSTQNSFNIDGATANSSFNGDIRSGRFTPFTFSQAAIEEFQVSRSSYNLQSSAGGAVVNAITRSGSNAFHGQVFGFYRDERFVGPDAEGNEAEDFTQLQYGFTLGGPIVRDRMHFFVSYDEQNFEEPSFREFRDFPAGREQDWEDLTGFDWERETGLLMGVNDARAILLKLDWQFGSNHLLNARYNGLSVPDNLNIINGWSTAGWSTDGQVFDEYDSVVISLNSVVTQRLMNEAFVQYAAEDGSGLPNSTTIPAVGIGYGLPWDGGFGQWRYLPGGTYEHRWQLVDNVSYSLGNHFLRGGFNLDLVKIEDHYFVFGGGEYRFDNWSDFLDGGEPWQYVQAFSDIDGRAVYDSNTYAAYFQDEWRATPSLSLIYGLRYDYQQHEQPQTTNPYYPLTGQIPNDDDNISARLGAAWDPSGDGKSVIRGGIGLFYDSTAAILDSRVRRYNGIDVVQVTSYCLWGDPCPTYPNRWDSLADLPPDTKPDIYGFDPSFENPQTLRISLGYEREIFGNFAVGIDFVYSESRDLQSKQDQNLIPTDDQTVDGRTVYEHGIVYPEFNRIVMFQSEARAKSRSMVLSARKRFSDRWFLNASYSWSKIEDNGSNQRSVSRSSNFPEDHYDINADWGPANFDVRHKIAVSGGVYLPYGFLVSGYVFSRSGFPYSAYHRDDLNRDGYRESERSVIETEPGVFFHYDRNTFRQPWFMTTNLRLSKTFQLGRGTEFEIIGEVFNLFDRDNWFTSNWTLSEGCFYWGDYFVPCQTFEDFGELNHAGRPRQYQLGLRLRF